MSNRQILTGWKEIAQYMGKGVPTVQRWEEEFGLPVRRPQGSDHKAVLARSSDLDAWLALRCSTRTNRKGEAYPKIVSVMVRTQLATDLETSRMLREQCRASCSEMRTALGSLREQFAAMRNKAA